MPGDFDYGGIVNLGDFSILENWWQSTDCNNLNDWCQGADTDEDGDVDYDDLFVIFQNWLSMGEQDDDNSLTQEFDFDFHTVEIPFYDGILNDECQNAIPVALSKTISGSSTGATGTDITSCGYNDTKDVWYEFTTEDAGTYHVDIQWGGNLNPYIAIFDECNGNEIQCYNYYSEVNFSADSSATYLLRIAGYSHRAGDFDFTINYIPPPDNDECQDATEIAMYGSYFSSTIGASGTGTSGCGWDGSLDVWFEFTPTSGEPALFTVEPDDWN
jgi:hypothetical protein